MSVAAAFSVCVSLFRAPSQARRCLSTMSSSFDNPSTSIFPMALDIPSRSPPFSPPIRACLRVRARMWIIRPACCCRALASTYTAQVVNYKAVIRGYDSMTKGEQMRVPPNFHTTRCLTRHRVSCPPCSCLRVCRPACLRVPWPCTCPQKGRASRAWQRHLDSVQLMHVLAVAFLVGLTMRGLAFFSTGLYFPMDGSW